MDFQSQIALDSGRVYAVDAPVSERMLFLRKTYGLVFVGIGVAAIGGFVGATTLLAAVSQYYWAFFIAYIAGAFAAYGLRTVPGVNYLALFGFTFLCGVTIGPLLWLATKIATDVQGTAGGTLIWQALIITGVVFSGLTAYVVTTKKDFDFLRGALMIGLFALIGFGIAAMFLDMGINTHLFVSIGGALLFSGFILYDTSQIVRKYPVGDHVGAAITLFLDFFLLFIYILRIVMIMASSRD
jgi:FtsH-binding integral membrane protein